MATPSVYGMGRALPTPSVTTPTSVFSATNVDRALPSPTTSTTPTPAATTPTASGPSASAFSAATSNLVRTGSLSGTPAGAAPKMATLVGPDGTRKAVAVDSADSKALFAQGYKLETAPPTAAGTTAAATTSTTPAATTPTTPTAPSYADRKAELRKQLADLEGEQFARTTEYTPEEMRNLSPSQQAQLRRARVTALSGQLGNITAAIQTVKEEEETAKTDAEKARSSALETLNTYLKYGVIDQLSEAEQGALAVDSGMNLAAIKKISEAAAAGDPPELRDIGGSLYSVAYDEATDTWKSTLVQAKPASGGGGGGGTSGSSGYDSLAEQLIAGTISINELITEYSAPIAATIQQRANDILAEASAAESTAAAETATATTATVRPADFGTNLESLKPRPTGLRESLFGGGLAREKANAEQSGGGVIVR